MGFAAKKEIQKFTYADYLSWDDEERWEIINGEAYSMSPAPAVIHQRVLREILRQLSNQLMGKTCEAFPAPFDVRLPLSDEQENKISNVVQPDISVICDPEKLDEKGCKGAPDIIIEILSPGTRRRDRLEKLNLYEMAGVKEYWLVEPEGQMVEVLILGPGGSYTRPNLYAETDTIKIDILKNISIDLTSVFNQIRD
ncbi:MAG: Uma2 family endonuclease [bacterium]|nr:Uma2 family endonuclease [bacterium]